MHEIVISSWIIAKFWQLPVADARNGIKIAAGSLFIHILAIFDVLSGDKRPEATNRCMSLEGVGLLTAQAFSETGAHTRTVPEHTAQWTSAVFLTLEGGGGIKKICRILTWQLTKTRSVG